MDQTAFYRIVLPGKEYTKEITEGIGQELYAGQKHGPSAEVLHQDAEDVRTVCPYCEFSCPSVNLLSVRLQLFWMGPYCRERVFRLVCGFCS